MVVGDAVPVRKMKLTQTWPPPPLKSLPPTTPIARTRFRRGGQTTNGNEARPRSASASPPENIKTRFLKPGHQQSHEEVNTRKTRAASKPPSPNLANMSSLNTIRANTSTINPNQRPNSPLNNRQSTTTSRERKPKSPPPSANTATSNPNQRPNSPLNNRQTPTTSRERKPKSPPPSAESVIRNPNNNSNPQTSTPRSKVNLNAITLNLPKRPNEARGVARQNEQRNALPINNKPTNTSGNLFVCLEPRRMQTVHIKSRLYPYKAIMGKIPTSYKRFVQPYDILNISGSSLWTSAMYEGPVGDPHRMLVRTLFRTIPTDTHMPLYMKNVRLNGRQQTGAMNASDLIKIATATNPPPGIQPKTWQECTQWAKGGNTTNTAGIVTPIRLMPFIGVRQYVRPNEHYMAMTMNDQLTDLRKQLSELTTKDQNKEFGHLKRFLNGDGDINIQQAFVQRNKLFESIGKNNVAYARYGQKSELYLTAMQPWGMVMSDLKQANTLFPKLFRTGFVRADRFRVGYPAVAEVACRMMNPNSDFTTMFQKVLSQIAQHPILLDILLRAPNHPETDKDVMMPNGTLETNVKVDDKYIDNTLSPLINITKELEIDEFISHHETLCNVLMNCALVDVPTNKRNNVANTLRSVMASVKWDYWYRDVSPKYYGKRMRLDGRLSDKWNKNDDQYNPLKSAELNATGRSKRDRMYAQFHVRMSLAWLSITWKHHNKLTYIMQAIHVMKIHQSKSIQIARAPRNVKTSEGRKSRLWFPIRKTAQINPRTTNQLQEQTQILNNMI